MRILPYVLLKFKGQQSHKFITMKFILICLGRGSRALADDIKKPAWVSLKGVWHEIFEFRLFHKSMSPEPMSISLGPFRIFRKFAEIFENGCLLPCILAPWAIPISAYVPLPHPSVGSSSPERRVWMSRKSPNPEWRGVWDPLSPPPAPALQTLDLVLKISKLLGNQSHVTYLE